MKKFFLLVLTICVMVGFGQIHSAKADTIALSLVMDGSGSIDSDDWTLQLEAYGNAIRNVIPKDGSVALNAIQFWGTQDSPEVALAQEEIGFSIIDSQTVADTFASSLEAIIQKLGYTGTSAGIELAADKLEVFDPGKTGAWDRWVIDVSTDGEWNRGIDPLIAATTAVDTDGADAVNAIGIGTSAVLGFSYGTNSFESIAATWDDFATAIETKLIREITGGQVPEPSTMLLLGFGLVGLAGLGRKKVN